MIPYGKQDITQADIQAVTDVLQSDFLTQGPAVPRFEQSVAEYCGAKYAIATNSATSSLHLACRALGLRSGDIAWTVPTTFVATANCILYCGANVDFVDIDPRTYTMSTTKLKEKLEDAKKANQLPKIVIPVHLCGQSCDMAAIFALSKEYNFKIIEDASHAIGGKYKEQAIGNCTYSDITVFSFHPVKIITSGEGGMLLCNDKNIAHTASLLRSHGITRDTEKMERPSEGPWYYQQIDLGYNYRMTDIHAALGHSQMMRLDEYVETRQHLAKHYDKILQHLPITLPWQHVDTYSSFHLYVICLQENYTLQHKRIFTLLREKGIGVNLHYIPVHRQPYYEKLGFKFGQYPDAERYYSQAMSIPLHPNLTSEEQQYIANSLETAINACASE